MSGLTSAESAERLQRYGENTIPEAPARPLVLRFVDELTHVMALLLWVAGGLAFVAGQPELGWAVWAVVVINAVFSFSQEYRAERALAELKRVLPNQARVMRDGELRLVPAAELVPGDVIEIEAGDRIAVDARLVSAAQLAVDRSALTGESNAVSRTAEAADLVDATPVDLPNVVLAGTTATRGRGVAVAYATGAGTRFGTVAHLTQTVQREASTLEVEVRRTARVISILAVGIGALVFGLATLLIGVPVSAAFVFAIGIVVANVPEGLLPTVTLALAMGVQRMARQKALVRRLSAVETLSAATIICTDKTGTLTKNEMTVTRLWTSPVATDPIVGAAYGEGRDVGIPQPSQRRRSLMMLLGASALCSNARKTVSNGRSVILGDPTEAAILRAAELAGLQVEALNAAAPRLREIPFDSERKLMTVVLDWRRSDLWQVDASHLAVTKGALVELLGRCTRIVAQGEVRGIQDADRHRIVRAHDQLASDGLRILGVAYREGGQDLLRLNPAALERSLTFVGCVAMQDPPREEVPAAIEACHRAGIRVTMITGDDPRTAESIGRRIGLVGRDAVVVSGDRLERMSPAELHQLLARPEPVIFARVAPEHKLRIVRAYQALGHVVGVTGDGVNDAPALRAANIGIAMGQSGTDVGREAADVVLLDDNFATIAVAIEQSRAIYRNLRKFFTYVLASNVPELVPFIAMLVARIPAALTIMQILSVDLGTDLAPALALGAEPPEPGLMEEPPRARTRRLLDRSVLGRAYLFLGMIEAVLSMVAFMVVWGLHGYDLTDIRSTLPALLAGTADPTTLQIYREATTATLMTIVACQVGNVFACRSDRLPAFSRRQAPNRLLFVGLAAELAIIGAVVSLPLLQAVFGTTIPPFAVLPLVAASPIVLIGLEEIRKWFSRRSLRGQAVTST